MKIHIIESRKDPYQINQEYEISIQHYLGSGSYGAVFDIGNDCVIKVFYHSILGNTVFEEKDCIIPYKNENRELGLYFEMMKREMSKNIENHVISPYVIGYTMEPLHSIKYDFEKFSYFVILPLCYPFHKKYKIKYQPLLHVNYGKKFIYEFLEKIFIATLYLEREYNVIHLDYKLSNIMYLLDKTYQKNIQDNEEQGYHENMMVIDFSLMKRKNIDRRFQFNEEGDGYDSTFQYYLWVAPSNTDFHIHHIPAYSICINILELLLGKNKVSKLPNMILLRDLIKEVEKENPYLGYFLKSCLLQPIRTEDAYLLFKSVRDLDLV